MLKKFWNFHKEYACLMAILPIPMVFLLPLYLSPGVCSNLILVWVLITLWGISLLNQAICIVRCLLQK